MAEDDPVTNNKSSTYPDHTAPLINSEPTEDGGEKERKMHLEITRSPASIIVEDAKKHGRTSVHLRLLRQLRQAAMQERRLREERLARESDETIDRIATAIWLYPSLIN